MISLPLNWAFNQVSLREAYGTFAALLKRGLDGELFLVQKLIFGKIVGFLNKTGAKFGVRNILMWISVLSYILLIRTPELGIGSWFTIYSSLLKQTKFAGFPLLTESLRIFYTGLGKKNHHFSVRSAYHLIHKAKSECEVGTSETQWHWNWIWQLKIPPKVKLLVWRICHNSLATKLGLLARGVNIDPVCFLCCQGDETITHLFANCPWSKRV